MLRGPVPNVLVRKEWLHSIANSWPMPRSSWTMLLLATPFLTFAQVDEGYSRKIKEFTTEPFFLTDLVSTLPASRTVPTPEKVLGHIVGAPNVLTYASDCANYLRELQKASKRIKVLRLGMSEEGREMVVAFISDEANLARLDDIKRINNLLADPRKVKDEAEANKLMSQTVPMYWATGGMHAPESGPPEMLMELAYRLIVSDTPQIKTIRKNSIVMITPVLDVDGRERVVDLYRYRKANPDKPEIPLIYWGKYVAHDDNRDGMALSLALSKAITKTWMEYKPIVFHDLHESVPYIYISTGTGPYNAWYDPIVIDEWHLLAYNEVDELTKMGVPGVWSHGFYDGWAASYGFMVANGHNAIGRFYETFSGGGADTGIRSVGSESQRDWFRPNPPFPKVRWSIRNNVNIMQSALLTGLFKVANEKDLFLHNFYLKSKRSIAKATTEGPVAWVLPGDEKKKAEQAMLLQLLGAQGVEVQRLEVNVETTEGKFPAGSYVVRMDQPYSRMADMMLDKQYYKASDPRSYDDTGWQLGPLFNVATVRVKDSKLLPASMSMTQKFDAPTLGQGIQAKIALVHTWNSTQDEGWYRMALDKLKVPYDYISVHTIRDVANLRSKYDVILMPPTGGTAQSIVSGRPVVGDPISWKPSKDYPNLGGPDQTEDIRGGIELEGVLHLKQFVNEGGLLICVGNMCRVPIDFGLVTGVSIFTPRDLNAPGGVFQTTNEAKDNPILKGYDDGPGVYFNMNSLPILQMGGGGFGRGATDTQDRASGRGSLTDPDVVQGRAPYTPKEKPGDVPESRGANLPRLPAPKVLLRFAPSAKLLIAGMIDHPEELAGKPALIQCPVGKGNILLFSLNPMWRMQTVGSYDLLFNAIRSWDKLK
jgi:hypothetical protein